MLLAECRLQNKRHYFPFYGFEFIERLCSLDVLLTFFLEKAVQLFTVSHRLGSAI